MLTREYYFISLKKKTEGRRNCPAETMNDIFLDLFLVYVLASLPMNEIDFPSSLLPPARVLGVCVVDPLLLSHFPNID